jgi:arylsulfatase A-like enzyme/Flp pilus assembly protein TadD
MASRRIIGFAILAAGIGLVIYALMTEGNRSVVGGVNPTRGANVLLITLDTTRADHVGCYGGDPEVTPVLDRLARDGVVFEQMQAAAPITLPSHTSMLTGLYPFHHGVRNNGMFALSDDVETLGTVFDEAGYATGAFVSASVLSRRFGLDRGFDIYDDDLSRGSHLTRRGVPSRRGDLTLEAALDWIRDVPPGTPFFCWIHLYDPHAPYDPPPEYRRRFPTDPYSGEIAFADALVGQAVEHLEREGLADTTFVHVVADHGEAFGEHGELTHAILLHQATTLVPWIVTGPGVPSGVRYPTPTAGTDIAATVAALTDLRIPNAAVSDGINVFAVAADDPDALREREIVTESLLPKYQYGWSPLLGLRQGKWQLTRGAYSELFDVERDPRELSNVSTREKTVTTEMEQRLASITSSAQDDRSRLELSRSELDQLEALGYLGSETAERADAPDPRDMIEAHVEFEAGRELVAQGDSDLALEALGAALDRDPNNVAVLTERARLFLRTGRLEEARRDFDRSLSLDPESATIFLGLAQVEIQAKNFGKALELAEIGSTKRGAFESLSVLKARALIALGRQEEARHFVDERLAARPEDPDLLALRGEFHAHSGDMVAAEELFRRAVTVDALHLPSRFMLAELLKRTGRGAEAVAVLEDLLRIQPGNPRALAAIGDIKVNDARSAAAYLEEAVRLDPKNHEALVNLGRVYIQMGLGAKAESMLRRSLEVRPGDSSATNNLAVSLIIQERLDDAEAMLRELIADHPDFAEARNNLSLTLARRGDLAEAEAEARRAIESNSELLDPRLTLASILNGSERPAEAVAVLEPFAAKNPAHSDFAIQYGIGLLGAGRAQDSLPWLERAMSVTQSRDEQVVIALARAKEALGRPREARDLYELAGQISTTPAIRAEALEAIQRLATAG